MKEEQEEQEELESKLEAARSYRHKDDVVDSVSCERCGGECSPKMVGDEMYDYCSDCGAVTF